MIHDTVTEAKAFLNIIEAGIEALECGLGVDDKAVNAIFRGIEAANLGAAAAKHIMSAAVEKLELLGASYGSSNNATT